MKNFLLKTLTIIFAFTLILGIFTACGEPETPAHTHDYKTLKYDTENHWYECECGEKINIVAHNLVNNTCLCGYEKIEQHVHDYKMLKYDTENHWYECECGEKQTVEKHKGGTATCTEKASCEVCREKYGELGECNYVNNICTVCGAEQTSEGLVYMPITIGGVEGLCVSGIGTCTDTEVVIANKYLNKPVLSIGDYAFRACTSLTSVVIPNSVTSIGGDAFECCTSLTSIKVDENNANYKSIDGNLYSKDGKTLIQYAIGKTATSFDIPNSVTSIGDDAFECCTSLTSIVIPNSVTSIGDWAFSGCSSLTNIVIPNSVTSIGDWAFSGCTSLTSIEIPNSVTSIGDWAFSYCDSLKSIEISNSVTSIGEYAFYDCDSLTSIVIPNSVTSIGNGAFSGCYLLTISCKAESEPISWSSGWNSSNRPVVWGYKGN